MRCGVRRGVRPQKNKGPGGGEGLIECIGSIILHVTHKYYMVLAMRF